MTRNRRLLLLLLLFAAAAPFCYLHARLFAQNPFWDVLCYAEAITNYSQGKSAFLVANVTPNIYPPIFVIVGNWLAKILTPSLGWKLFVSAHMASVVTLPLILAGFYLRGMSYIEAFLLFLLAPLFLTESVFFGGNIASLYYALALITAVPGLSHNRWRWFYPIVIVAAATKFTFLLLLLLPLFLGVSQIAPSVITTAATGAVYLAQRILIPDFYRQFQQILAQHTFTDRDYGYGPFGLTANVLSRLHIMGFIIPGLVGILFGIAILLCLLWLRGRVDPADARWRALILLTVTLLNPRMMDYDVTIGVLPAYFLLFNAWRRPSTWLLCAISLAGLWVGHGTVGVLLFFVSAFLVGANDLHNHERADSPAAELTPFTETASGN